MAEDLKMPLTQHLEELRWCLIKSLVAVATGGIIAYNYSEVLFAFLIRPLTEQTLTPVDLIGTGVTEAFFTKLKVSFIAGVFAGSPVIFFQAWKFIAPGLYESEKRLAVPFMLFATLFFVVGAAFCYFLVFPVGYAFFVEQYKSISVQPNIRISEYLSFSSRMLLAFGATFELPVVTFFLARIGVVTHQMMLRYFRYALLIIFIVAAVLTPGPDIASQLLMAGPLLILYGISIGVAYAFARETPPADASEDSEAPEPPEAE